ncbi:RagB/SusD family nutrient uptake outer membrane protein [Chitinophaga rhizosphaerae]|uniref:RagB/SusD family nutrient uptake outer membrane protein n=1 Tax=Chitinophaga rhizosphaerae TaxID=1864947 RepID=UPI000F7FACFB|nr:RagB/SusD family nutrient uptake outer membrane protein [Chitinophaga rhizosphaerae]
MKPNQKRNTIILGAALLLGAGCGKGFLEQDIPGRMPLEGYYKTDADARTATFAAYDMLQAEYNWGWGSPLLLKTLPSDESNAGGNGPGDQPHYQALDNFTHDAQGESILWVWRMNYFGIYRANQVINRVAGTSDLQKRYIAESKVLRAYYYSELTALWGDVPLVLKDLEPSEYTQTKRIARAEVYAQIEKDLQEAIPVLSVRSGLPAAERFRVSKGTAQSLLGKVYLYQKKWALAAEQFNNVINSGEYDLEASVAMAFSQKGEFGIESVFEVPFTDQKRYTWDNFPWDRFREIESNIHIKLMGPREEHYTRMTGDSLDGGWGFNVGKKKLFDAFVAAGDVVRRKQTMFSVAELTAGGGKFADPTVWDFEGYIQRKYGSFSTVTTNPDDGTPDLNYGTNTRLIRYADVLLMAAEAYYRAGNEGRARAELNKVRKRAKLADVTAAGDALFDAIVRERQLELAFEGLRYLDLVRWGRAEAELGPLGYKPNKHELLPVPDEDVRIGHLEQNKGY